MRLEEIERAPTSENKAETFKIADLQGLNVVPKSKLGRFAEFNAQQAGKEHERSRLGRIARRKATVETVV